MKRNADGTRNVAQKFGYQSSRELMFSCNETVIHLGSEVCNVQDKFFPHGSISHRVWYYF